MNEANLRGSRVTRRAFLATVGVAAAEAKGRPNVVLILTDDQGYGDLGCHGNSILKTPNLDRLHRESIRFTNFYSSPLCAPTRSSLMTGRYSYRTGIVDTWVGLAQMRPSEVTMAETFRGAGYRTGIFGKWHLGDNYPMRPVDQGFDQALIHTDGAIGALGDPAANTYFDPVLFRNGHPEKTSGYCTDVFFGAATAFLKKNRRKQFLLYLPTNVPHGPLQIADSYVEPYRTLGLPEETARVYGMIANLDENVGRLLELLQTTGLERSTIVVFMSDNGPWGPARYNGGLRDQKGTIYDGGIKVPFFVRAPGQLGGGIDVDRIAAHIDVLPTLLDLCRISPPANVSLDGRSLVPLLKDRTAPWNERTLFFQQSRPDPAGIDEARLFTNCAARSQRYKIVMTARNPQETYTKAIAAEKTELYDLVQDPGERSDIANRQPGIVARMRKEYQDWYMDVMAGVNPPVRIHLGAKAANPVTLTPQDLRGPRASAAPWNYERAKTHIKTEPDGFGYWEVEVSRAGRYEFVTRLGSPDMPASLKQGTVDLRIGEVSQRQPIAAGASRVVVGVRLSPGPARLQIAMGGQRRDGQVISPFFVDVKYLGR